jgi:methyl-accepting chemotaxis protein
LRLIRFLTARLGRVTSLVSQLSLRTQLLCFLGLLIAVMLGLGLNDLWLTSRIIRRGNQAYQASLRNVQHSLAAKTAFAGLSAAIYQHLGASTALEQEDCEKAIETSRRELDEALQNIRPANPGEEAFLTILRGSLPALDRMVAQAITLSRSGQKEDAARLAAFDLRSARLAALANLDQLVAQEVARSAATAQANEALATAQRRRSLAILFCAAVAALALGIWASGILSGTIHQVGRAAEALAVGDLTGTVRVAAHNELGLMAEALNRGIACLRALVGQVAEAAGEVAAAAQELTAVAEAVQGSTRQISGLMAHFVRNADAQATEAQTTHNIAGEMAASLKQVSASAETMAGDAKASAAAAERGQVAVTETVAQMDSIRQTVTQSAVAVQRLGERSRQIGSIIEVITRIADQTNLLALNAAIEAARAGEHGRGFSVVANEVRSLADQSRRAADQIAVLIGEIQAETDEALAAMESGTAAVAGGSEVVARAGQAFGAISRAVQTMGRRIEDVRTATEHLVSDSQTLFHSISTIAALVRQSAAEAQTLSAGSAEQAASSAAINDSVRSLTALAQNLQETVSRFRF